jgi:hypothetical protein
MKERLKNRYRERKGQIQLLSFLTVLVVSVTFLGLAIPKIMAGDTQVSDLILQGESKEQSIALTLKDEHPEDTKIVIPLPEGVTYTSNPNPNIGVTYDELNKQLVIDWVEGEEKQVELQLEAEQEGRYDFTARTVRDGEPVTSSTCSVFIEETLDLKENTAPSIDLQNNEETIDSTTLKDNRNEEGSTETVSQIPGEFAKKELNRTLGGTFGEKMSTSYSTDRYVTTYTGRFIPLASDLFNKEPVILKPYSVIASALKENFEWLVYDTTINFKFARLAGPAEIVGNSEGRETHILYSTDGINFSEEIPDDFKEVKVVRTKIKMNMTTGFPNEINPEMPIDIITSPEWGEIETFASTKVSVWDKNNNLIDSSTINRNHSFLVNQRQDINVNYVDTNGNKIGEPHKFTDYVGFPYDVSTAQYKPIIAGYQLDESQLPENAKGIITEEPQTVTYVYKKKAGDVIVKYVDTQGKEIDKQEKFSGFVGDTYESIQKSIDGYKFKKVEGADPSGKLTDQSQTVTYIYTSDSLRFYSVPEELEFNPTKIGNRTQTIERKDPTWKMVVEDNRLNKGTWRVTASLAEQFQDSSGQPLENNILIFSKGNQSEQWITSGSDVDVFEGKSSEDKELYDVSWNENEGPLLQVAPGAVKVGKYTGVITWQLVDAPV